jgi:hypothetical protein
MFKAFSPRVVFRGTLSIALNARVTTYSIEVGASPLRKAKGKHPEKRRGPLAGVGGFSCPGFSQRLVAWLPEPFGASIALLGQLQLLWASGAGMKHIFGH